MSIISKIKGWWRMLISQRIKEEFNIEPMQATEMDLFVQNCMNIYQGHPSWVKPADHIKTANTAKTVCSEIARLTTLGIGIACDGEARGEWLQGQIDDMYFKLRDWVEYGCAAGTVVLKPNGNGIECYYPEDFRIMGVRNGKIVAAAFFDEQYEPSSGKWYSRVEYHRFTENGEYAISNRCRIAKKQGETGKPIPIEQTPWNGLEEDVLISGLTRPLFGVFKTPAANNVDIKSPLGLPCFAEALEELRDFDVAYSLNSYEIERSKRIVMVDSDRMLTDGKQLTAQGRDAIREEAGLPDYVKLVEGTGTDDIYHEINPVLNTETRITGINNLLSMIGYKCGFSNGYFVLNEKTGRVTAREVESDDQRTIQLIKDFRDKLEDAVDGVIYALNAFADLYDLAPAGKYEVSYSFGDITYSYEEDKTTWWGYVVQGKMPAWRYFVKFEGFSEEEAKALVAEAQPQMDSGLFTEE